MENSTFIRPHRVQIWQKAFLLLVMMLLSAVGTFAQSYSYEVTKTDVICDQDAGSVTLTITNQSTKPNGSAQIRKSDDPNTIINTGTGTLDDDVVTDAGNNTWKKTWYGVPAGSYVVYFEHDGTRDEAGAIEVVNKTENYTSPTMTAETSAPFCTPTGDANGKVTVTVKDGVGPFHFTATITRAAGGEPEVRTSGENYTDRAWTVDGLAAGDQVKITVADTQNGVCPETSTAAQIEVTIPQANNPSVSFNGLGLYREVLDGSGCNMNDYFRLRITGGTPEARQAQKELLISSLKVYRWSSSKIADLEYVEEKSYTGSNGTEYVVFKTPQNTRVPSAYIELKYQDLCSGKEVNVGSSPMMLVTDFGKENKFHGGETMKLTPVAQQTVDDECNPLTKDYHIEYYVTMTGNKWGQGFTNYYFPTGTKASIQKKEADGLWTTLFDVPLDGIALFQNQYSPRIIDLNDYGEGTYRIVYDNGCSITTLSKEVTLKASGAPQLKSSKLDALCFYGIHGNTAGTVIDLVNSPATVNVTIEKADGTKSTTFMATDFLSDKEYQYTMNFPIYIENYKPEISSATKEGRITIGDLPVGEYKIYVDRCGQMSEPAILKIEASDLKHYTPSNENGYKNGVRVDMGCEDGNKVSFDFGIEACTPTKWYDLLNLISWQYWRKNGNSSSTVHERYKEKTPIEILEPQDRWQISIGFWKTANVLYSAMEQDYVPGAGPSLLEESFSNKIFTIDFNPVEGKGAFEFQGAMCDGQNPNSGMISIGIKEGFNATYPLHYEIKKATESGGIVTPDETVLASKDITGSDPSKHIFTGLTEGWYQVTAAYNYGSGAGCPVQKKNVYVSGVGIPEVDLEWEEHCYGQGLPPNHLELPVSNYMYDVKWYLVDGETEQEVGAGNAYDAVFTQPGTYTYKAKTWFAQGTSCAGSPGGEKTVVLNVGDCTSSMQKNLWVGNVDTDFSKDANWTVKVPGDGEDIIFATADNNTNPTNLDQAGAAQSDCILPEGAVLTIGTLENRSDKSLVVSKTSSLVVTNPLIGFDQPSDAHKLVIKTDETGQAAGGSFAVAYDDPCATTVYGTVELYGRGEKLGTEKLTIKDNLPGSPTYGRTLYADPYSWQQIGIPVGEMSPSPVFKGSYLQSYAEAKNSEKQYYQKWSWMTKESRLLPFVGYQLTQDEPKVYSMTGKLNLCDQTLTLTREAAEVTASKSENVAEKHWGLGQNIFANSYTAGIDISQIEFPEAVEPTVYVYHTGSFNDWIGNASNGGSQNSQVGAGGYLAVPKNSATTMGYKSIPSTQGFLLKFTNEETKLADAVSMTIPYASVVRNDATARAKGMYATSSETGGVQLVLEGDKGNDVLWLIETAGTTPGYDRGWDGPKLLSNASTGLYVQTIDGQMQVSATSDLTQEKVTVAGSNDEMYKLTIRRKNLPQYEHLKLADFVAHQLVDLSDMTTTYNFSMNETGTNVNRFMLVNTTETDFGKWTTGIRNVTTSIWSGKAVVYTTSGEAVARVHLPEDMNRLKAQLPNGVYVISMQAGGRTVNQKLVITK
ncbi:MAG: T9SS C-terminal target domain-containing protein [Prevotella sp.]|jgi:hypothetical protein